MSLVVLPKEPGFTVSVSPEVVALLRDNKWQADLNPMIFDLPVEKRKDTKGKPHDVYWSPDNRSSCLVVVPSQKEEDGEACLLFYGGPFSNFKASALTVPIGLGDSLTFPASEAWFKTLTLLFQGRPVEELDRLMKCTTAAEIKQLTTKIPKAEFDVDGWDKVSPNVMWYALCAKIAGSPELADYISKLLAIIKENGVSPENIRFYECSPTDFHWGIGKPIDEILTMIKAALHEKPDPMPDQKPSDLLKAHGQNKLGQAWTNVVSYFIALGEDHLRFKEWFSNDLPPMLVQSAPETKEDEPASKRQKSSVDVDGGNDEGVAKAPDPEAPSEPAVSRTLSLYVN